MRARARADALVVGWFAVASSSSPLRPSSHPFAFPSSMLNSLDSILHR